MTETRTRVRSEAHRLIDRVKQAVDEGACTAEEIHKRAAALPLDVLERLELLEGPAQELRRIEEQSIGAVYDLVRGVNREVAKLAGDWLGRATAARRSARRPRKSARRRKVEAATEAV